MTIDLYKIYHLVSQRARRNVDGASGMLALKMKRDLKSLLSEPTVRAAEIFRDAEIDWFNASFSRAQPYGPKVLKAIETKNYEINRPVAIKNFNLGDDPAQGYIYIASAVKRAGQVKIGYTTLDPIKRLQLYRSKHGYPLKLMFAAWVSFPARIEKLVHDALSARKVKRSVCDDSVEWYQLNAEECVEFVKSIIEYWKHRDVESCHAKDSGRAVHDLASAILEGQIISFASLGEKAVYLGELVEDALNSIVLIEAEVLKKSFGFHGHRPQNFDEISKDLGLGFSSVKDRFESGLKKLRHPSRSRALMDEFGSARQV